MLLLFLGLSTLSKSDDFEAQGILKRTTKELKLLKEILRKYVSAEEKAVQKELHLSSIHKRPHSTLSSDMEANIPVGSTLELILPGVSRGGVNTEEVDEQSAERYFSDCQYPPDRVASSIQREAEEIARKNSIGANAFKTSPVHRYPSNNCNNCAVEGMDDESTFDGFGDEEDFESAMLQVRPIDQTWHCTIL